MFRKLMIMALASALTVLPLGASVAQAQSFPSKPIKIVVPFTPGGGNDVFARVVGQKMSDSMGQPVIVENKPGAAGNIGADFVAKSPADGYTLLIAQNGLTMNPWLMKNVPFDLMRDLTPVGIGVILPIVLVVNPALPVHNVRELIAYAKANPGKISYASPGVGTPHHLSTEMFKTATGVDMVHVPYKGAAGMVPDLISGQVQVLFGAVNSLVPHIQSGKLRAIATAEGRRISLFKELPTVGETVPGFETSIWVGLMAPAGTPEPVIAKLNDEMVRALAAPDVRDKLTAVGFEIAPSSVEQMRTTLKSDLIKWDKVVRAAGIKAE